MSAPTITNRNPDPSVAIGATDPISFDIVLGSNPLLELWISAKMGTTLYEVVYDGAVFGPQYAAGSRVTGIAGGYRFRLRRTGGWASAPTILTKIIDTTGLEAS